MPQFDGKINDTDEVIIREIVNGAQREYAVTIAELRDALNLTGTTFIKPLAAKQTLLNGDTQYPVGSMVSGQDELFQAGDSNFWDTDLETSQAAFVQEFSGIALEAGATEFQEVPVQVSGIYRMPCASGQYLPGTLVGPNEDSSDLSNTEVVEVATENLAIGRVYGDFSQENVTEIDVEIISRMGVPVIDMMTDNSGGSADDVVAAINDLNNTGSADADETRDAVASLVAKVNELIRKVT